MKGAFSDGTLTLEKSNGDIEIPITSIDSKQLVTSGDITQFVSYDANSKILTVNKDFDIEYIFMDGGRDLSVSRCTVSKGKYNRPAASNQTFELFLGYIENQNGTNCIGLSDNNNTLKVICAGRVLSADDYLYTDEVPYIDITNTAYCRLYA